MNTKEILHSFAYPGAAFRGKPFWSWNGELRGEELVRQAHIMKEMGLGGYFMPRARDSLPSTWARNGLNLSTRSRMSPPRTAWKHGCTMRTAGLPARLAERSRLIRSTA